MRAALGAMPVWSLALFALGCQHVFGVDFLDDPKRRTAAPAAEAPRTCSQGGPCPGELQTQDTRPCADGEPDCAPDGSGGSTRGPAGSTHLASLVSGARHVCTIVDEGLTKCVGSNAGGELGDDTTTDSKAAVSVLGLAGVRALAAGGFHTCALLDSGAVKCWGSNVAGQLGDGTLETRLMPVDVPALGTNAVALTAGASHTCALLRGGAVKCWGGNEEGQLGNDSTTGSRVPVDVPLVATSISSGVFARHTCASTAAGISCWGSNRRGQLGNGTTDKSLVPNGVAGLGPGAIAVGVSHTCALTREGVFCWGDNRAGELGTDGLDQARSPVVVDGLRSGATRLTCGAHHCCVALESEVMCWGNNRAGQLGDPTATRRLPVPVPGEVADSLAAGEDHSCARRGRQLKCWGHGLWSESGTTGARPVEIGGLWR